jgi:23S rRNA G2445 N2-methylase RlmL
MRFDVPRPRGLLGHQHLTRLVGVARRVVEACPPGTFKTLHLSAAGADSVVFARLGHELASALQLEATAGPAQLQLAVYPTPDRQAWNVAIRVGSAPLSARPWRVCNYLGALNATIAHVMAQLGKPSPADRVLNIACGSGTLLVERLDLAPARIAIGVDLAPDALTCARANLEASGHAAETLLVRTDATRLPLADESVDAVVSDLPFGQLIAPAANIADLYRGVVAEVDRVAAPGARFVAITTRHQLFEAAIEPLRQRWRLRRTLDLKVSFRSGYLRPRIYVLKRQ